MFILFIMLAGTSSEVHDKDGKENCLLERFRRSSNIIYLISYIFLSIMDSSREYFWSSNYVVVEEIKRFSTYGHLNIKFFTKLT